MSKKIILAGLNARYTHSMLSLYYLQSVLGEHNITAEIKEYNINQPHLEMLSDLAESEADIYCFGIYIWNSRETGRLLEDLHEILPGADYILGGPEVGYNWGKWQKNFPWVNHIVCGSGEGVIAELAAGKRAKEQIIMGMPVPVNELPFVYRSIDPADMLNRYWYYETSRGCPYSCAYCLSSRQDQKLQQRDLKLVFEELEYFIKRNFAHIKLVDRTFNADRQRAGKIWQKILDLYKKYPDSKSGFHFEIHPALLIEEDFEILKNVPAGRFRFELGVQTLNKKVMQIIHRNMDWPVVKRNIQKLKILGNIHLHLDLIAGLPEEDFASFGQGFDEVAALNCGHLQLGFLKLLPGTEMAEKAKEFGIVYEQQVPYEVLQTRVLSWQELSTMRQIEELLEIFYNSGRWRYTMKYLVEQEVSIWKLLNELSRQYKQSGYDLRLRNWEKSAKLLYKAVCISYPAMDLLDPLRRDWCVTAQSHSYPPWLDSEILKAARESGYGILREKYKLNEIEITAKAIKQAIFYCDTEGKIWCYYGKPGNKKELSLGKHKTAIIEQKHEVRAK